MEQREIEVQRRELTGSSAMRRVRSEGFVPAVVYSGGEEPLKVTVSNHSLLMAVRGCLPTQVFTFKSDDKELNGVKAFIKDVQTEPIKDRVLHVDFLSIVPGRSVTIETPIRLVGEPAQVKAGLAVLEQRAYGLMVECDPDQVPAVLEIDVSELSTGQSILAHQVSLPENVTLRSPAGTAVAAMTATRAASMAKDKEEGK